MIGGMSDVKEKAGQRLVLLLACYVCCVLACFVCWRCFVLFCLLAC